MYYTALVFHFFKNCRVVALHPHLYPCRCFLVKNTTRSVFHFDFSSIWKQPKTQKKKINK